MGMIHAMSHSPRCAWRPPNSARKWRAGGFTLVELLVALVLLGFISVLMLGGLRFGARAWEAGDARIERIADVQVAQRFLRRQIAAARPLASRQDDQSSVIGFAGDGTRMRLIAPLPAHLALGGLYRVSLFVDEHDGRERLMLAWQLYQSEDDDGARPVEGQESVLVDDVAEVEFAYLRAAAEGGDTEWVDRWEGKRGLPVLVRVEISFDDDDGRTWPPLIVAPMVP